MDWIRITEILGNLGDFLGSIAVLATLLYLAAQMRAIRKQSETEHLSAGIKSENTMKRVLALLISSYSILTEVENFSNYTAVVKLTSEDPDKTAIDWTGTFDAHVPEQEVIEWAESLYSRVLDRVQQKLSPDA